MFLEELTIVVPKTPLETGEMPYFESVAAGFPSPAEDYKEEQLDLNKLLVKNKVATFFIKVEGDSMVNAGIYPNDILIVDRSLTAKPNDVIIAYIEGNLTCKRYIKAGHRSFLIPENANYQPIELLPSTDFRVWGVVTRVIHTPCILL